MEVTANSVADVQQRADKLATALGGRVLVAYGGARERIDELSLDFKAKAMAAPAVFVELPTAQVAAFKKRLLAETEPGLAGRKDGLDTSAMDKNKPLALSKLSESRTSADRSSVAPAPAQTLAPQVQRTEYECLQRGTVAGGVATQQQVTALSVSQQVGTVLEAVSAREETTARIVLEIRVVLPSEQR
jgi:hypothetical protein